MVLAGAVGEAAGRSCGLSWREPAAASLQSHGGS